MADRIITGTIDITEGRRSPASIVEIASTLARLILRVSGNFVVTTAAALQEDGVLNLLRRIVIDIGGVTIKTIGDNSRFGSGGKLSYYFNQLLYGNLPRLNQPAVGVATNPFDFLITIPFEMPRLPSSEWPDQSRRLTMLSPTPKDIEVYIDWGDVNDVMDTGVATLTAVQAEISAVIVPDLDAAVLPLILQETTQQVAITAGQNTADNQPLNKVGKVPYIGLLAVNAGLRNDVDFNLVNFLLNTNVQKLRQNWIALKGAAQEMAQLQAAAVLPLGVNFALFDDDKNGDGVIELDNPAAIKGWNLETDHEALTATFRLYAHHYHIGQQGAPVAA